MSDLPQNWLPEHVMAALLRDALEEASLSQAEFARMVGVSAKHLNQVLSCKSTTRIATLDYWAFVLGYRWDIKLSPRA